jgi:hypothetical protein
MSGTVWEMGFGYLKDRVIKLSFSLFFMMMMIIMGTD